MRAHSASKTNTLHRIFGSVLAVAAAFAVSQPSHAAKCPEPVITISPTNQNVAEASVDGNGVRTPTVVSLSGTATNASSIQWARQSGPSITINNSTQLSANFTAPEVDANGASVKIRLSVTNSNLPSGCSPSTTKFEDTTINISNVNRAPVAALTASPATVNEGALVTLSANDSSDPDNDALDYQWVQTGGTPVTLTIGGAGKQATFTAPNDAYPLGETLTFKVTVSDGALDDDATVAVNVKWLNDPPVAVLACTAAIGEGGVVTLDASGSSDADDGIVSYSWLQTLGPPDVGVTGQSGPQVYFNAPFLTSGQGGLLRFQVTVRDASNAFSMSTCNVQVNDVTGPVLNLSNITTAATSPAGATVSFSPTATDAVEGAKTVSCTPASGSLFPIATTAVNCSASDSKGNTTTGSFTVTVTDTVPPTIAPHSDVTAEATSSGGATVSYTLPSVSDNVYTGLVATCTPASGSNFPLGDTTVNCTATDGANNIGTSSFVVHVVDTTAPTISNTPEDITAEATSSAGATVNFTAPTASDIVGGNRTVTCLPASGSTFAIATTTVNCTASDTRGNSASSSFKVTVKDTTGPVVTVPANMTVEATSAAGVVATFSASANDAVDGSVAVSCTPSSGSTFPLAMPVGVTTVNCSATDTRGNPGSASFTVTVQDTKPPVLTLPSNITVEATGPGGATATYSATALDVVDGSVTVTCTPASGSAFVVGTTTVNCSASDARSNIATGSFSVKVEDTTPPVVTTPASVDGVEATGSSGAAVSFTTSALDIVDGSTAVSCTPASGSTFAIGSTSVNCTSTDNAGNVGSKSFSVTVVDTTAPALTLPGNQTKEATGPGGATVTFAASANDIVDGARTVNCTPASGSLFPVAGSGVTTVNCSASDTRGNTANGSFTVTITDTTPPAITAPTSIADVEATSSAGAAVTYAASAADVVDGAVAVSCLPASGSTFAIGTTIVTCNATDAHGNNATKSFPVIVVDTTPPVLTVPGNMTVEATGPSGAAVTFSTSAVDVVDGIRVVTCTPSSGSTFPIAIPVGITTVSCSTSDMRGNSVTKTFTVTVKDTTAPVITGVPGNQSVYATGPSGATVSYTPLASDLVDGSVAVTCTPAGTTFAPGTTSVTCTATDAHGNSASKSFSVTVNYNWNGFFQPINNAATNYVKAGSAIPVKFTLGGNMGLDIFATENNVNYPRVVGASCTSAVEEITDAETVTAGNSSLQFDGSQYIYVWKSEKSWSGRCLQLQVKLKDGSVHVANFGFTK